MTNFTGKTTNNVVVTGTVYEADLAIKVSQKGNTYVAGSVHVETSENNVVEVKYSYVAEKNAKTGAPNQNFKTLASLATNVERSQPGFLTAEGAEVNKAKFKINGGSMRVRLTPSLVMNDFVAQDGQFAGGNILDGGFVSTANLPQDGATFKTDAFLQIAAREMDKDGNESGRLTVNGMVFDFTGKANPVKFLVENPKGVEYFEDLLSAGATFTQVWGNVNNTSITQTKTTESAFGEANVVTSTYTRREFVVTGAAIEGYDMEDEAVIKFLTESKQKRETHLADVKARHDEYQAKKAANAGAPTGNAFGGSAPAAPAAKPATGGFNF